jgi:transglutaminase-like putative cysteine protease
MRLDVSHRTTYRYRQPVAQSAHILHLEPRRTAAQIPLDYSLTIEPTPASQTRLIDYFGNAVLLVRIEDEHRELVVQSHAKVDVAPQPIGDLEQSAPWEDLVCDGARQGGLCDVDVVQFSCPSRHTVATAEIVAFASTFFPARRPVLAGAFDLTRYLHREFRFDPLATNVSTPVAMVLEQRRGVCQDFAHLAIAVLRVLGLPARYVSGYLLTRPPPGQPRIRGVDASHAWLGVWTPESGWVDFDPTNGLIPSGEHITVGWGRDYEDVCPVGGVLLGGGDQEMKVAVDIETLP